MRIFGSPRQRAAHYREQAAQLREWAATAVRETHRKQLAALADDYESLAATTESATSADGRSSVAAQTVAGRPAASVGR